MRDKRFDGAARQSLRLALAAAGLVTWAQCAGEISPAGTSAAAGTGGGTVPPTAGSAVAGTGGGAGAGAVPTDPAVIAKLCQEPHPGEAPIRRLSRAEYNRTVADLLGDSSNPAQVMPPDSIKYAFESDIGAHAISAPLAQQYEEVAENVAARAVQDLSKLLPCDPLKGEETCARAFIAQLCPRAYRRACTADDTTPLFDMWQQGRTDGDFKLGVRYLLEMVLQSADFLYRPELGEPARPGAGFVRLTGPELATRLSYFLWGTMPDATLAQAAARGDLATKEGVATQARRLLADARAHETVMRFHEQWLGLDELETTAKSSTAFPDFDAARPLMKQETRAFVDALWSQNGDLATLLAAPYTFLNDKLATFYGLPAPGSGAAFSRVPLDGARHAGILTQGSFLSVQAKLNQSSPVMRGVTVLRQVLCASLPPPPADLKFTIPQPTPDTTTRARFQAHESDPNCSGCHKTIDGVGFGLESFDAVGRWRDKDNGIVVDASGALMGTDIDGPFNGASELAHRLASSAQVRACYTSKLFYSAQGRPAGADDACSVNQLSGAAKAGQYRLQDLVLAVTQTDAFLYRTPVTP